MASLIAMLCMFGVGVTLTLIGAVKHELARRLDIGNAKIGGMITALMLTSAVSVILLGILKDIIGFKLVIVVGFSGSALAVVILTIARSYRLALFSCMLLGVSTMCMNLGNTLLLDVLFNGTNPPAASNLGNIFFGLGAFLTPLIVGVLVRRIGYTITGLYIAVILFIPAFIAAFTAFPSVTDGFSLSRAIGLLQNPVIMIAAAAMFFYVGLETSLGGWISTYANECGYSERGSNLLLSCFWISMMFGRLTAAISIDIDIAAKTIFILSIIAFISLIMMINTTSRFTTNVSVFVTGISFGPMFPTVIGITVARVDKSLYGSTFGIVAAIALLGGSILPAIIGYRSQGKGMHESMRVGIAAAAVLMCFTFALTRLN